MIYKELSWESLGIVGNPVGNHQDLWESSGIAHQL